MGWVAIALMLWGVWKIMENGKEKEFLNHFKAIGGISPLKGRYRITSHQGFRRHPYTKKVEYHNGVDGAVPCRTPIRAPYDGYVQYRWTRVGGHQIFVISLDGRLMLGFAHLATVLKKSGRVRKGEIIAYTGRSGDPPGPAKLYHCHLHATAYLDGKRINAEVVYKKLGIFV